MTRTAVFVTGGAGFVGRRLIPELQRIARPVVALARTGSPAPADAAGVTVVRGDLLEPDTYLEALQSCDVVVHLAAATGRATAAEHARVNARGTEVLLEACRQAGVSRFLFVSSIATTFPDVRGYAYAQAKQRAEAAVTRSGLRFAILRPTIILGAGAPILGALEKLAALPVIALPGSGRARVQPIHVQDVARAITVALERDLFTNDVFELGGSETVTMEGLVQHIRRVRTGREGSVVHIPLWCLRPPLRIAEAAGLGRLLPISAGQLSSFEWDGVAAANRLQAEIAPGLAGLPEMTTRATVVAPAASHGLDAECDVFTRHLLGRSSNAYVCAKYAEAHRVVPSLASARAFDRALVRIARVHPLLTRITDAYAALFARSSLLRKKLVLLLAILETCPPFYRAIDAGVGGSTAGAVARLAWHGTVGVASLAAGVLVLLPLQLVLSFGRRGAP